jgi:hypothetical protein
MDTADGLTADEATALIEVMRAVLGGDVAGSSRPHVAALVKKGYVVQRSDGDQGEFVITRKGIDFLADEAIDD